MKYPKVYILLINYNGWEDTIDCLNSLRNATYPNFHVVVLDNASKDDSVRKIKEWTFKIGIPLSEYILNSRNFMLKKLSENPILQHGLKRIELIRSDSNLGFCAGNNIGMEFGTRVEADYFLVLNNDTTCEPTFLEPMVHAAEARADVGLIGGIICYHDDPNTIWWAGGTFNLFIEMKRNGAIQTLDNIKHKDIFETDWITGCMMLIPRKIFESVGGFDEEFFIWSEDWDISLRVRKKGYKLLVVPSAKIYHKIGKSLGIVTPLCHYYATRNKLLLRKKHYNWIMRMVSFIIWFIPTRVVRYTQFIIQGRYDLLHAGFCAIRDYFLGRKGKWNQHAE